MYLPILGIPSILAPFWASGSSVCDGIVSPRLAAAQGVGVRGSRVQLHWRGCFPFSHRIRQHGFLHCLVQFSGAWCRGPRYLRSDHNCLMGSASTGTPPASVTAVSRGSRRGWMDRSDPGCYCAVCPFVCFSSQGSSAWLTRSRLLDALVARMK